MTNCRGRLCAVAAQVCRHGTNDKQRAWRLWPLGPTTMSPDQSRGQSHPCSLRLSATLLATVDRCQATTLHSDRQAASVADSVFACVSIQLLWWLTSISKRDVYYACTESLGVWLTLSSTRLADILTCSEAYHIEQQQQHGHNHSWWSPFHFICTSLP